MRHGYSAILHRWVAGQAVHMTKKNTIEFEDMNLQVGVRLQILLNHSDNSVAHYSTLIGYVAGEYLLLTIPQDSRAMVGLQQSMTVVIRVFTGVSVFTFESRIEALVQTPRAFMLLAFPVAIQKVGLRKAVRVKANLPVRVKSPVDAEDVTTATLSDISLSGALISTSKPLGTMGDMVSIEFSLTDQTVDQLVTITTTASIRSLQQSAGSTADGATFQTVYSHGINFHDIDAAKQVVLQNFVYETLLVHRS